MADKMMRTAGRGPDGTAKAIRTDSEGNIISKSVGVKILVDQPATTIDVNTASIFLGNGMAGINFNRPVFVGNSVGLCIYIYNGTDQDIYFRSYQFFILDDAIPESEGFFGELQLTDISIKSGESRWITYLDYKFFEVPPLPYLTVQVRSTDGTHLTGSLGFKLVGREI